MRKTTAVLAGLLLAVLAAAPVSAAWGGQPDADQHPMVGALYFDWDANGEITDYDLSCSGSYAGVSKDGRNDVFLTAGHCVAPMASFGSPPAYVSFDNDVIAGGVSSVITAVSYTWDPAFGHDSGDLHDLGVVLLPLGSVSGIQPVVLPRAGYMDDLLRRGALKDLDVEAVGYGVIPMWQLRGGAGCQRIMPAKNAGERIERIGAGLGVKGQVSGVGCQGRVCGRWSGAGPGGGATDVATTEGVVAGSAAWAA